MANQKVQTTIPDLHLAFDVGHSSIGWAVLQTSVGDDVRSLTSSAKTKSQSLVTSSPTSIEILGCGAVTFRADDCLASTRRGYRRQRRHIRSTRQRIKRLKRLLAHLGVLTEKELDKPGCAWPWQLAARVLSSKTGENPSTLLSWSELWDVLRWYAHNRGYDGNRRWSKTDIEEESEVDETALEKILNDASATEDEKNDAKKVKEAKRLMRELNTPTMAETFCAVSGIDPLGSKRSCNLPGNKRPKAMNAAFPRKVVEGEVRRILRAHFGLLKNVNASLEKALLDDWQEGKCPAIKLPNRYQGGLLFGQLVPRFDNRIISTCAISGEKVPARDCPEFLNFRWAMQLANIRVGKANDRELRPLNPTERSAIDQLMRQRGYLTPKELKEAVRVEAKCERDNLDTMLMHPDAKEALLLDPIKKLETSDKVKPFWTLLPERLQKRIRGQWRRGKAFSFGQIRQQIEKLNVSTAAFDAELQKHLDVAGTKTKKDKQPLSRDKLLGEVLAVPKTSGRAPFARQLMKKAYEEVMAGKHPKEEGNSLFITDKVRQQQLNRDIAQQTNNHLVRHRLLILERLLGDMVKEYAGGDKNRVVKITVEVNRDLREMSGKTAKEKAQDLGLRIANHHAVADKLEKAFAEEANGRSIPITAGLIRKARIAEDLGWKCPYTGQSYEPKNLITRYVDKDHIVPRSDRASDSLDSLVVTFSAINKWKGKRTAWEFVAQEQGKTVPDMPNLSIVSLTRYKQFVEGLETFKGHDDDKRRKKKRKDLMLLPNYEEKEFVPRDLTQTSQLVRLAAQVMKRMFADCEQPPVITSLPGSVTGTVRKAWKVLSCLGLANPQVLDENGDVKSKTDIRNITHLHHALDACVLGLTSHFIPNNGRVWELIVKRKWSEAEQRELMALGVFGRDSENRFQMRDLDNRLKEQIRQRLAEKRVVQHIPARMDGLRVEQNVWRVLSVKDGEAMIQQTMRGPDGKLNTKTTEEKVTKLLGVNPKGEGKLQKLKGALVIPDNFGVALDPQPTIIPFHKVWARISELKETNGGKWPRIIRNGQLIRWKEKGRIEVWRVFSIKNTARGIMLDIGRPDQTSNSRNSNRLTSFLKNGVEVLPLTLTGIMCPTTSSA
jgi:hypothetical protein